MRDNALVAQSRYDRSLVDVRLATRAASAMSLAVQGQLLDRFGVSYKGRLWYPRIAETLVRGPFVLFELDPRSLHDQQARPIRSEATLRALGRAVEDVTRSPRPMWFLDEMVRNGAVRPGYWFVTTLAELRPRPAAGRGSQDAIRTLPAMADVDFDLSAIPAGRGLMVPIGRTDDGEDFFFPLLDLLHVKVIGTTGYGKSNWLKAAIIALTRQAGPDELKVAIISPKVSDYAAVAPAHLWTSKDWDGRIASNEREADALVMDLQREFERRDKELFVGAGVNNLDDYVARTGGRLPRVLLVVDELINLVEMAPRGSRIAAHITGFTSVARSPGFHVFAGSTNLNWQILPTSWQYNVEGTIMFRVADGGVARRFGCDGAAEIPYAAKGRAVAWIGGQRRTVQAYFVRDLSPGPFPRGGGETAPLRPRLAGLTAGEADLVLYADGELGGKFSTPRLFDEFGGRGWPAGRIKALARRLEEGGWLAAGDRSAGASAARVVTAALVAEARSVGEEGPGGPHDD